MKACILRLVYTVYTLYDNIGISIRKCGCIKVHNSGSREKVIRRFLKKNRK